MNFNLKMLKNDLKRNPIGNLSLVLFMTLSAILVVSATLIIVQLTTSISSMYDIAKPPHFLQMHKGEINQVEIDDFNSSYEGLIAWQSSLMINVYGKDLEIQGDNDFTLSDSRLDISLVKQNENYDLLLDGNRNKIVIKPGEIGIPLILKNSYSIAIGDTLALTSMGISKEFKVSEFVHDAQMNSPLVYSTRILLSDEDFDDLDGRVGEKEYLIESYFTDTSMASSYQTAYENSNLPQNGPAITYSQIFLISAFADILMAIIIILVSLLLVGIALISIKYTIMGTLEEEIGEIGTMKAIGMTNRDISSLYLKKYRILLAVGSALGFVFALPLSKIFTKHISSTFGQSDFSLVNIIIPILSLLLIYLISIHYCKRILGKLKKVSVVDALVLGKGFGKKESAHDGLFRSKRMPTNILLSIREVFYNFKSFILVYLSILIVSAFITVPLNLSNTLKSKDFIPYMGSPVADILIEVDLGDNLEERYKAIKNLVTLDDHVKEIQELKTIRVETINADKEWMNLKLGSGKSAGQGLQYLEGGQPSKTNELALSKLNADEMNIKVGESAIIRIDGMERDYKLTGIYQDVTSGGMTAKTINTFPEVLAEKYQFIIHLKDGFDAKAKASNWTETIGSGYDIQPMEELVKQTLGVVSRQVQVASIIVLGIGLVVIVFILALFMKLRLIKDYSQIATMKAIGLTNLDVRKQYLYKISLVSILAILSGVLLSTLMGEKIISFAFNLMGLGISRLTFIMKPLNSLVLLPLLIFVVSASVTWLSTKEIENYTIISRIDE